ncbi:hypothetical protein SAMN04487969_114115 [Paenibacillus algorifonticola]|uniref:Uncharacterized protein n=1 Tax=Paenibacillus algorifonticola TaxID=684063 RepID=A0A1I2G4U7_9BACL|nr:hypothetical protein [Paenibacillus algorifonticola]SFF11786.1 hypothetical protein SAMN04487969_114115 [Paenibacillus algorifonticola]
MPDKLKNMLKLLQELWFVPFVVYTAGLVYVQGSFHPYLGDLFIFKDILSFYPVSQSLYWINGIYISFFLALPVVTIAVLASRKDRRKPRRAPNRSNVRLRRFLYFVFRNRKHPLLSLIHGLLFLSFIITMILFQILTLDKDLNLPLTVQNIFFYSAFFLIFYFSYQTASYFKMNAPATKLSIIFVTAIILIFSIYLSGIHAQYINIMKYEAQKSKIEMSRVTLVNETLTLIKMDISSDYYIGYHTTSKRSIFIAKDNIDKIENFQASYAGKKRLADPSALNDEEDAIIKTLQNYYDFKSQAAKRTKACTQTCASFDAFKKLQSNAYISNASDSIRLKYLQNNPYRGKEEEDYYGVDFSLPERIESEARLKAVYVKEYWKDDIFYIKYTLQNVADLDKNPWIIIKDEEVVFDFQ